MASMPVAAVTWAGKPSVNSGSRIAQSGSNRGETTPFFSVVGVVTIAIGVTSEPVPAVVGNEQQRKTFALGEPNTVDIVEAVRGFGEIGHKLRGIECATTSD